MLLLKKYMANSQTERDRRIKVEAMIKWLREIEGKLPKTFEMSPWLTVIDSSVYVDRLALGLQNCLDKEKFLDGFMATYLSAYELKKYYLEKCM